MKCDDVANIKSRFTFALNAYLLCVRWYCVEKVQDSTQTGRFIPQTDLSVGVLTVVVKGPWLVLYSVEFVAGLKRCYFTYFVTPIPLETLRKIVN
jgi:hypothetical protein